MSHQIIKNVVPPVPDIPLRRSEGYLGNRTIKAAGVAMRMTPEHIKEYKKCKDDILHFCKTYFKIVHPDHGLINFIPYEFQEEIIEASKTHRNNLVVTGRQSGKTTVNTAIILHYVLFNEDKNVAVIANKAATARLILSRIQKAFEHLPKWLQQGVVEWNKGSVEFENGCKIFVGATTSSSIRGNTISMLFIDEVAFIDSNLYEDFIKSVYPTISSGKTTKIFMVSTPNGMNHFYKLVKDAREKKSNYHILEYDWTAVPGRDEEWKKNEIANTSPEIFAQEYECQFQGSTRTLLSGACLTKLSSDTPLDVNEEQTLRIYREPEDGHLYFMSIDVSEGLQQDSSTISVIDITQIPYQQVATYRSSKISPLMFPGIIYKLGKHYNNAWALVENNSVGYSVVKDLNFELGYENVLYVKASDEDARIRLGLRTTSKTKKLGCLRLKDILESYMFQVRDEMTILELYQFVEDGISYSAEVGYHDDLVMGLVNFAYYSTLPQFTNLTTNTFKANFVDSKRRELENSLPALPYMNMDAGQSKVAEYVESDWDREFDRAFYR